MNVRDGEPADTDAICRVAREAWHAAYDDVLGADVVTERTDEWYDPSEVRRYFEEPTVSVYVAGDPVVGYAFTRHDEGGDSLYLTAIYVHPDRWGEGIGSRLLDRVETEARDLDVSAVELVVLAENDIGRDFYERHGYQEAREREERIDDSVSELVYEKSV